MPDESAQVPSAKFLLGLSGGGYRAAVYHLGMLARLDECGLLKDIDMISSVSGGSLLAGVLANEQRNANKTELTSGILQISADKVISHAVTTDLRSAPLASFWLIYSLFAFMLSVAVVFVLVFFQEDFNASLEHGLIVAAIPMAAVFSIYLGSLFFSNVLWRTFLMALALSLVYIFGFQIRFDFVIGTAVAWFGLTLLAYYMRFKSAPTLKVLGAWLGRLGVLAQLALVFSPTITRTLTRTIPMENWLNVLGFSTIFFLLLFASEIWSTSQNILLARFYERSFLAPDIPNKIFDPLERFNHSVSMTLNLQLEYLKHVFQRVIKGIWCSTKPWSTAMSLQQLPPSPRFVFNATLLNVGYPWQMTRDYVGNARIGRFIEPAVNLNIQQPTFKTHHPLELPISEAVAISACFPPLFTPRRFSYADRFQANQFQVVDHARAKHISERFPPDVRRTVFKELWLNDGGNFDNLGVDPLIDRAGVLKSKNLEPVVLISDAGADPLPNGLVNKYFLPLTYLSLIFRESRRQRVELLRTLFREDLVRGAYVGIGNRLEGDDGTFLNHTDAKDFRFRDEMVDAITRIRTDLAPMSREEVASLVIQGYVCTCVQLRKLKIGDGVPITKPASILSRFNLEVPKLSAKMLEAALARS